MEHLVFQRLWRWSKRRHPQKSADWARMKYFRSVGERNWVFGVPVVATMAAGGCLSCAQLSETAIKRHKKIKGEYNPFDPQWEQYGEQLRQERMWELDATSETVGNLVSCRKADLCAFCGCALTEETGWHEHHLEYRMHGGTDALSNRVLLHPYCHQQVHAGKLGGD